VRNSGTATATTLKAELRGLDVEQEPPQIWNEELRPDVIPDSEFAWPLITHMNTAPAFRS
jgi:hypothetical protein